MGAGPAGMRPARVSNISPAPWPREQHPTGPKLDNDRKGTRSKIPLAKPSRRRRASNVHFYQPLVEPPPRDSSRRIFHSGSAASLNKMTPPPPPWGVRTVPTCPQIGGGHRSPGDGRGGSPREAGLEYRYKATSSPTECWEIELHQETTWRGAVPETAALLRS